VVSLHGHKGLAFRLVRQQRRANGRKVGAIGPRDATRVDVAGLRHSHGRLRSVSRWLERPQRSRWRQKRGKWDGASVSTSAVD
jgi:hypothetical protein